MTEHRLQQRQSEIVRRDRPVRFRFDGSEYTGYEGDTISSALWANGVQMVSRSFKYHRPRADLTFDGSGPNALVQVDGEPNVRAGSTQVRDGMEVQPQNVTPSLNFDVMAVNGLLHRFLPVGFYYKAFHSKRLWPFYEEILRHMAGLGQVDPHPMASHYDKQYRHAEVVVVGGGPAGLSAAAAAGKTGARVLLVEHAPLLGGHLRYWPGRFDGETNFDVTQRLVRETNEARNIEVLTDTAAMGHFGDGWVPATTEERLYKIRAKSLVIATGALNRTLVFTNNDLPGIMMGDAAARLLNLYAVRPGEEVLVVSANDAGLRLARDLAEAGLGVSVAEERDQRQNVLIQELTAASVPIRWRHTISAAHGRRRVTGASLLPLNPDGSLPAAANGSSRVECDTIVLSVGYAPRSALLFQSEAKLRWDELAREMLPVELPPGVHAAGRVCGSHDLETTLLEGQIAGQEAAADAGFGPGAGQKDLARLEALQSSASSYTTRHVSIPGPGPFRFVDFAEDVTEKDVHDAMAEGYTSIELLKRYTTISMGPDQGRYSAVNAVLLTAEANSQTVDQTGTTTSRPPTLPVKMSALRERFVAPVRRTPLHAWHKTYGCQWLNAGQWKRAEIYDAHTPAQEALNVRQNVGIIDVSTLGKIRLAGEDVLHLLSRVYTNKWDDLSIGDARYGVMCSEEGALIDDGVTARLGEDQYYMTTSTANASAVPERLRWWLEQPDWDLDVHLVNVTAQHAAINVAGPKSRQLLSRLAEGVDLSNNAFPFMAARRCKLAGVQALLLRIGFTGELSYEIHVAAGYGEHVWRRLLERGEDLGIMPFSLEAQGILRLEKGHFIGQDLDAITSPLETEAAWAVELDGDDFLGKHSILRKQRKGLTRKLVGFQMNDASTVPPEGNLVVDEGADGKLSLAGWVTSARFSPTLEKSIGLAWVPHEWRRPGTEITIRVDGQSHRGKVAELPFYDPKGRRLRS